jgi:histidinol-phosphate aminotransferase
MKRTTGSRSGHRLERSLVRPVVGRLRAYMPGEQPKITGLIKLNTNENPYPPDPEVLEAIRAAADGRLRLYPNPTAQRLREKLARLHECSPANLIIGNGSDELLALATRAFVEPKPGKNLRGAPPVPVLSRSRSSIQYLTPSYSLYPVLAAIHNAQSRPAPLGRDFTLPGIAELRRGKTWDFAAALTYVTTPNAPSGRGYMTAELESLCRPQRGVVILDEAYADFASENALELALKYPNVIISRTFSKAYSLCFQRVGYFVGPADLIAALDKIRDSYNVNGLGQIAAEATLDHLDYYQKNFRRIVASRDYLSRELQRKGFEVFPSQTNFILTRPIRFPARVWLEKLRARKILVRWFDHSSTKDYLRITIGTEAEVNALLSAVDAILK